MRVRTRLIHLAQAVIALAACADAAWGQFDPSKVVVEPEAIARQFPDPSTRFASPAFDPGRQDFTSHAEAFKFLDALAGRSPRAAIETIGHSQEGRAMLLVVLSGTRGFDPRLPTVMLLGQQHGNEPAGGEAGLVLAQMLATERSGLLDQVNVLIMPRANPDGAAHFGRVTANGVDVNRDHLLIRTPEAQAINAAIGRYQPQVLLDLHEFTVAGRWVSKFSAMMRYDALLQAASVGNLNPKIEALQARYVSAARAGIETVGQSVSDYHTASSDPSDKAVSMGGVNVDTGRNVGGLRHAVSILIETRGVGLGRAHLARRVQAHVSAALAVVETAARDGASLLAATREAGQATAGLGCRGDMAVVVAQTPQRRTLGFVDAATGDTRDIDVEWRSSLQLTPVRNRPRPCGYLLDAGQMVALGHLRALGIKTTAVVSGPGKREWSVERYVVDSEESGQRQDARGAIADDQDGGGIRVLRVSTRPARVTPPRGAVYVPMNQPLAGLVSAALEPDSQNSFAANRLLEIADGGLVRVIEPPAKTSLRAGR